jgi:hypothetical protein
MALLRVRRARLLARWYSVLGSASEQVAEFADDGLPGGQVDVGGGQMSLHVGLVLGELAHFAAEFVLGPVGVAHQVEVGVFLGFQVGEAFGQRPADTGLGAVPVGHGGLDLGLDGGGQVVGQPDGGVVADHFVFDLLDG